MNGIEMTHVEYTIQQKQHISLAIGKFTDRDKSIKLEKWFACNGQRMGKRFHWILAYPTINFIEGVNLMR